MSLFDENSDTELCLHASFRPVLVSLGQELSDVTLKLVELLNGFTMGLKDETLGTYLRSCEHSEFLSDFFVRTICRTIFHRNSDPDDDKCWLPKIGPKGSHILSKSVCSAGDRILSKVYEFQDMIDKLRQGSFSHQTERSRRSLITIFGGEGVSAEVSHALSVDNANIKALFQNELSLESRLTGVERYAVQLFDRTNNSLLKVMDHINTFVLFSSINSRLVNYEKDNKNKILMTSLMITKVGDLIESLRSLGNLGANLYEGSNNCLTLHGNFLCGKTVPDVSMDFLRGTLKIGAMFDQITVGKRHQILCVPGPRGQCIFDGLAIVSGDKNNVLLSDGRILNFKVTDKDFNKNFAKLTNIGDCFYRAYGDFDKFLVSCNRAVSFRSSDGTHFALKSYETRILTRQNFPVVQSNREITFESLINNEKRKKQNYRNLYESLKQVEVSPNHFLELLDEYFALTLEKGQNSTSLLELIYRNPNVTSYFGASLALLLLGLISLGVFCYCKYFRRVRTDHNENEINLRERLLLKNGRSHPGNIVPRKSSKTNNLRRA